MEGYYDNIDSQTLVNKKSRVELYANESMRLVLICLGPKESIGEEVHSTETQFTKVVKGVGLAMVGDKTNVINQGMAVIIPPGKMHNIINVSAEESLKMYTIYSGLYAASRSPEVEVDLDLDDANITTGGGDLPDEMQWEIFNQGTAKQYLKFCQTNKAHMKKCMTPSHWVGYMKGRSIEDAEAILKFAHTYIKENPWLFVEVVNQIILEFGEKSKNVPKQWENVVIVGGPFGKAKAKASASPERVFLKSIHGMILKGMKNVVSVDYTEEKYGFIADILSGPLAKIYMELAFLEDRILGRVPSINKAKKKFLWDFVSSVKISDRRLDEQILDLAPLWMEDKVLTRKEDLEEEDSDEEISPNDDMYVQFFDAFESYIKNNRMKSRKDISDAVEFFTSRMEDREWAQRIIDSRELILTQVWKKR